jgi:hypothetical protein
MEGFFTSSDSVSQSEEGKESSVAKRKSFTD